MISSVYRARIGSHDHWVQLTSRTPRAFQIPCASALFNSKMANQPVDFFHDLKLRLLRKPKRKSTLGPYFEAHHALQDAYQEPPSSPDTPVSSGFTSTTTQLSKRKRSASPIHDIPDAVTNKAAKRRCREDGSHRRCRNRSDKLFSDNKSIPLQTPAYAYILTHFGAEPRHINRLSTCTLREQNGRGSPAPTQLQTEYSTISGKTTESMILSDCTPGSYWRGGRCLRSTKARDKTAGGESLYIFRHRTTGLSNMSNAKFTS